MSKKLYNFAKNLIMKRFIAIITLASAVNALNGQEMKSGNNFLSVGLGPAANYWTTYHSGGTPAIHISLDHGFREAGPGTITLGGALGFFYKYYKSYYSYHGVLYNYKWNYTYFSFVFRSAYYYNLKEADIPDMNVYGGVGMGLLYSYFRDSYNGPSEGYVYYDGSGMNFLLNLFVGANYFFTPKIAAYLEFGYDISLVTLGLTFNLD